MTDCDPESATKPEGAVQKWVQMYRKDSPPQLKKMWVCPLGKELPEMKNHVVKPAAAPVVSSTMVLRVTIRKQYVLDSEWVGVHSKPSPTVLALACPEGTGLVRAYGWRDLMSEKGTVQAVGGFLKVTDRTADEAFKKSGQEGIFFDNLAKAGPRPPVTWLRKERDEDDIASKERS